MKTKLTERIVSERPTWIRKESVSIAKERAAFYKSRPKSYVNGRKKPGLTSFGVSLDLTKRRYSLLSKTKSIIKDNPAVISAFTVIN